MAKMVVCTNNGVLAILTELGYQILKDSPSPEAAYAKGVQWIVCVSTKRACRNPELGKKITATIETWADIAHYFVIEERQFYVPLSNGPQGWHAEEQFVRSWSGFLDLVAANPRA